MNNRDNTYKIENPVVSIIIPVYNAATTLSVCVQSLFNQTYSSLELLFINDCSTDDSLAIIKNHIEKSSRNDISVKILTHDQNKGVAAARNTGLENASGKYIYYVDADDWIENDTIEKLVKEAERTNADIVGHEWYLSFNKNERYMKQTPFCSSEDALKKMMSGVMRWNLWLFLVRRALYEENHVRFIPGMNMGEDMMVMIKLFTLTEQVVFLPQAFYHYAQINSESVSKVYSKALMSQVSGNMSEIERFISSSRYNAELSTYINFLKLNIKLPLLMSDKTKRYKEWNEWFPEADKYIMENGHLSLRTKLVQWMAARKIYIGLKLYHFLVYRLVYGIIYK